MVKSLTGLLVLFGLFATADGMSGVGCTLLAAEASTAPKNDVVQANSDFAFDLYRQLATESEGENLFFSPFSISSALAMTAEGARGQTALEIGTVLRFPEQTRRAGSNAEMLPWETAMIHAGVGALNRRFNREKKPYALHVANALWGEQSFPFRPQFVKALNEPYGAALNPADFIRNFEAERQRINEWVAQKTNDRIKDLLPEGILDESTRLVLTNASYFKGSWSQPFGKESTRNLQFTLADGKTTPAAMMNHDPSGVKRNRKSKKAINWPFGYVAFDADGEPTGGRSARSLQILELPYTGAELSMFVLLPSKHDGLPALENQMTNVKLNELINHVKRQEVAVWFPKFKIETEYALKPTLLEMGMPSAFEPGGFAGMSDSPEAKKLYISAVQHKAFVEVNEEGTEAAAATAVLVQHLGLPRYPTFAATRPFLFLIRDNQTGSILFLGRMTNPSGLD